MNEQVLRFSAGPVRFLDVLQPQQLLDDPVAHSHGADQNKQVKDQLAYIAPYGGNRRDVGIDRRRRGSHDREDDAGKRNNRPFEANACIGTQEVFPNIAGGFPCETGHGNWGDTVFQRRLSSVLAFAANAAYCFSLSIFTSYSLNKISRCSSAGGEEELPEMRLDIQMLCLPNQSPAGKEKKPKHFCFDFLI